jgi:HTH-type transcriptional regulator / antitoxin HigA
VIVMIVRSRKTIAIPPGATIKEQLLDKELSQKEFAVKMDMPERFINKLIHGDERITTEIASRLERVLGIPALFWCRLEAGYRADIAKVERENRLE